MIDLSALKPRLAALAGAVCLMWAVSLSALYVDRGLLYDLALHPREVGGLVGILGMPFVHGSLHHLLANTVPLLIMGGLLVARGAAYFLRVSPLPSRCSAEAPCGCSAAKRRTSARAGSCSASSAF